RALQHPAIPGPLNGNNPAPPPLRHNVAIFPPHPASTLLQLPLFQPQFLKPLSLNSNTPCTKLYTISSHSPETSSTPYTPAHPSSPSPLATLSRSPSPSPAPTSTISPETTPESPKSSTLVSPNSRRRSTHQTMLYSQP
ncbi:malonyl-coenzyme:anthocyanin 5-o-glucoside-6'''-o-malonyltransferase, partial [Phtheirospermum japonicum]